MYTYIDKAIQACKPLSLLLDDGSKLSGIPSWGMDSKWLKLSIVELEATLWISLNDIKHVTT
ncbi:hypothetical protein J41TS12_10480 [Paenibacillus antibioticophila]|uniref:Uncharacterized protein n=1 Tax=Paenibacillus antibioticophila TaxID=1274374 RepID=A0A919XT40_9BACL|nr:hypothetical protein [Paenibacillus antibioticophila]GIO36187.1 hypothetical protein J41TS12_10480 [Paenibacillus antibioticophila]